MPFATLAVAQAIETIEQGPAQITGLGSDE